MSSRCSAVERGRNVSIDKHQPEKGVIKFTDQYPFTEQHCPFQALPVHVWFVATPQSPFKVGVMPVRHFPATEKVC